MKLEKTTERMKTYTGQSPEPNGDINVSLKYKIQVQKLVLYVVPSGSQILLSRDWLRNLQLDWSEIHQLHINDELTLGVNLKKNTNLCFLKT